MGVEVGGGRFVAVAVAVAVDGDGVGGVGVGAVEEVCGGLVSKKSAGRVRWEEAGSGATGAEEPSPGGWPSRWEGREAKRGGRGDWGGGGKPGGR